MYALLLIFSVVLDAAAQRMTGGRDGLAL